MTLEAVRTTATRLTDSAVDEETQNLLKQWTKELQEKNAMSQRLKQKTVEVEWSMGKLLNEAQQRLARFKRGIFVAWLRTELPGISISKAYNLINLYRVFNFPNFGKMKVAISVLYMLSATSTPTSARQEAVKRIESGEKLSCKGTRKIIEFHKKRGGLDGDTTARNEDSSDSQNKVLSCATETEATFVQEGRVIPLAPTRKEQIATAIPVLPAAIKRRLTTEDGVVLRYHPDQRAWCKTCGEWRHFILVGQDIWQCKTCSSACSDDAMEIWIPGSGEADRERKRAKDRQAYQRRKARAEQRQTRDCQASADFIKTTINMFFGGNDWKLIVSADRDTDDTWQGNICLTPPCSLPQIASVVDRLSDGACLDHVQEVLLLVKGYSSMAWFQKLLRRYPVCFLAQQAESDATFPCQEGSGLALFYVGQRVNDFAATFGRDGIGVVLVRQQ
jgi:ribosomal protein L37AE/L43A